MTNVAASQLPVEVLVSETARKGAAGRPAASAAGAPPLPCLTGTISDEGGKEAQGNKAATLHTMLRDAGVSGYWWKAVSTLVERVKELAEDYGLERLGFLTLTFPDDVQGKKEAERRFNNFARRILDSRYQAWIKVFERGAKRNRLHFHLLVVLPFDIRTGFDFEAYQRARAAKTLSQRRYWTRMYGVSAPEHLRKEWRFLRGYKTEP